LIHKISQVVELREKLESGALAKKFQLFVVDHNIMTRKFYDSNLPSNYNAPIFCQKMMDLIPKLKLVEVRPVIIWDLDHLRIEDHLDQVLGAISKSNAIWFLTSANLDKHRLVPLLQQGASGFLLKPFEMPSLLEKVKEALK
jgi:DNA-binding NtrC family response regulator